MLKFQLSIQSKKFPIIICIEEDVSNKAGAVSIRLDKAMVNVM